MPSVEEIQLIFEKFQKNFETVTLTLIGQMNKITENLSRISEAMELTDKINIQNVENKQLLNQMDKQMKMLLGRLERMSKGGFEIPELPPEPVEPNVEDLLSASYSPSSSNSSEDEKDGIIEPVAIPVETKLVDSSDKIPEPIINETKELIQQEHSDVVEQSVIDTSSVIDSNDSFDSLLDSIANTPNNSSVNENKVPDSETNLEDKNNKSESSKNQPNEIKNLSDSMGLTALPIRPPDPVVIHTSGNSSTSNITQEHASWDENSKSSISGWLTIESPQNPKEYLQNLMVAIENASTIEEVGNLIIQVKEQMTKLVPFNGSYFEMVMYSGPKRAQKGKPNTPEIKKEAFQKIQGWITKFN